MTSLELIEFCKSNLIKFKKLRNKFIRSKYTKEQYKEKRNELRKWAREIKHTNIRNLIADYEADITIISREDCTLVIVYWEQNFYTKYWEKLDKVEYYGYWNNTDKPDDIIDEEWDERGKEWEKALNKSGIPGENG